MASFENCSSFNDQRYACVLVNCTILHNINTGLKHKLKTRLLSLGKHKNRVSKVPYYMKLMCGVCLKKIVNWIVLKGSWWRNMVSDG